MMLRNTLAPSEPAAFPSAGQTGFAHKIRNLVFPFVAAALAVVATGCVDDADDKDGIPVAPADDTPTSGRYGAIGNSLTAGFINGGLIEGGQLAGYPMVLAEQAGWTTPQIPRVASPGIGSTPGRSAFYVTPEGAISTVAVSQAEVPALLLNARLPRPYDNLGVPGATTKDLLDARDALSSQAQNNSYFDLILRNGLLPMGNWTVLEATAARNPEILTLWIGNNDILGGALGGNPVVGSNITPPAIWAALYAGVLSKVDAMNPSVVAVANIPNITDIPYVTTVPARVRVGDNIFPLFNTEEEDVAYVLMPFMLYLASLPPEELPQVMASYLFPNGTNSIQSDWTLTSDEAQTISETSAAYNQVIEAACSARGWAYVDIATELAALPKDLGVDQLELDVVNGYFPLIPQLQGGLTLIYNPLSAFSLDGVHPSEIGSTLIANAFARALNATYGTSIPEKDLATVENITGFEEAPFGRPGAVAPTSLVASQDVLDAIETLPSLLGIAQ
ncbi:MAG: SGNH/GDSL hydrolase family protein [Candidatus Eisenbacteria bacterium]